MSALPALLNPTFSFIWQSKSIEGCAGGKPGATVGPPLPLAGDILCFLGKGARESGLQEDGG